MLDKKFNEYSLRKQVLAKGLKKKTLLTKIKLEDGRIIKNALIASFDGLWYTINGQRLLIVAIRWIET